MTQRAIVLRGLIPVLSLFGALAANSQTAKPSSEAVPRYRDSQLSTEDRVADLLTRRTLEEKVEQITGGKDFTSPEATAFVAGQK